MALRTRLTERLKIEHPIISAPMGMFAGGRLAAAVSQAGGLGLIGGGYGDPEWLDREFAAAGNAPVGCGFITWSLAKKPELLDQVLERAPAALMLSFGPVRPFADRIREAGVPMICQVQSIAQAEEAVEAGAVVIVAQGGEAGGHGGNRATLTLVPEVADFLASSAPDTLLVAAGGIADGRGLAAALMLGADGVLIGSRLLASSESAAPKGFLDAIIAANGDATVKTTAIDVVRNYPWPAEFKGRALNNRFLTTWHGREQALAAPDTNAVENERYWKAFSAGEADNSGVFVGEAAGLIRDVRPAAQINRGDISGGRAASRGRSTISRLMRDPPLSCGDAIVRTIGGPRQLARRVGVGIGNSWSLLPSSTLAGEPPEDAEMAVAGASFGAGLRGTTPLLVGGVTGHVVGKGGAKFFFPAMGLAAFRRWRHCRLSLDGSPVGSDGGHWRFSCRKH